MNSTAMAPSKPARSRDRISTSPPPEAITGYGVITTANETANLRANEQSDHRPVTGEFNLGVVGWL